LDIRQNRKKVVDDDCLPASGGYYIPIYEGMAHAAGNNVVTVRSTRNEVTGAISLTAITLDPVSHMQIPANEPMNPNVRMLIFLLFIQGIYVGMILRPVGAYLLGSGHRPRS
jgi:hypothetical protein